MERDPNISKLIKESGLVRAPDNFTDQVMGRIGVSKIKESYRPLIGRSGIIIIALFIVIMAAVSLLYSGDGGSAIDSLREITKLKLQVPDLKFNLDFLSKIKISTWMVSTLVALFVLVLTDAWFSRRKRVL